MSRRMFVWWITSICFLNILAAPTTTYSTIEDFNGSGSDPQNKSSSLSELDSGIWSSTVISSTIEVDATNTPSKSETNNVSTFNLSSHKSSGRISKPDISVDSLNTGSGNTPDTRTSDSSAIMDSVARASDSTFRTSVNSFTTNSFTTSKSEISAIMSSVTTGSDNTSTASKPYTSSNTGTNTIDSNKTTRIRKPETSSVSNTAVESFSKTDKTSTTETSRKSDTIDDSISRTSESKIPRESSYMTHPSGDTLTHQFSVTSLSDTDTSPVSSSGYDWASTVTTDMISEVTSSVGNQDSTKTATATSTETDLPPGHSISYTSDSDSGYDLTSWLTGTVTGSTSETSRAELLTPPNKTTQQKNQQAITTTTDTSHESSSPETHTSSTSYSRSDYDATSVLTTAGSHMSSETTTTSVSSKQTTEAESTIGYHGLSTTVSTDITRISASNFSSGSNVVTDTTTKTSSLKDSTSDKISTTSSPITSQKADTTATTTAIKSDTTTSTPSPASSITTKKAHISTSTTTKSTTKKSSSVVTTSATSTSSTTHQVSTPGEVTDVNIHFVHEFIEISWQPPTSTKEETIQYRVNATAINCTYSKEYKINKTHVSIKVKPNCLYTIQVSAVSKSGVGPAVIKQILIKKFNVDDSKPDDEGSSLIIGLVAAIASLLLLGALSFILFKIWTRKHRLKPRVEFSFAKEEVILLNKTAVKAPKTRPIKLQAFISHVEEMHRNSNLGFSDEFKTINKHSPKFPTTAAEQEACRTKNRYTNVLAFDHSRVKLLPQDDDEGSDYINANYIPGYNCKREYIAAQGPLPCTKDDFWRMIWENKITIVVMLTQCKERGRIKCETYWPSTNEPVYFGDLIVQLRSESVLPDYMIRILDVIQGSTKRVVKHFHFLKWPDFGCPEKTSILLNFVRSVRGHMPHPPEGPTLVHCSAGVGRTGTFIAVDYQLQHIKEYPEIDIAGLVMDMRAHRPLMVQTENQYVYIHDCIRDALKESGVEENNDSWTSTVSKYLNFSQSQTLSRSQSRNSEDTAL